MISMLQLHPSLDASMRGEDRMLIEHVESAPITVPAQGQVITPHHYIDSFGNRCARFTAPAGTIRLTGSNLVEIEQEQDPQPADAAQYAIQDLPAEVLQHLLASRYCEVDRMCGIAYDLFGSTKPGWERAAAIRDWVHGKVRFDYRKARPTKTAMDVYTEREGVCRDFQHLAVTLTRAMNIPARYVTGYLGDIRVPYAGPGDFSAWYQVFLDGKWWNMDARHNQPRYGRLLIATGRDAADVAITTSFGQAALKHFWVESNEVDQDGKLVPVEGRPEPTTTAPVPINSFRRTA